jgi:hypothetical protein
LNVSEAGLPHKDNEFIKKKIRKHKEEKEKTSEACT